MLKMSGLRGLGGMGGLSGVGKGYLSQEIILRTKTTFVLLLKITHGMTTPLAAGKND